MVSFVYPPMGYDRRSSVIKSCFSQIQRLTIILISCLSIQSWAYSSACEISVLDIPQVGIIRYLATGRLGLKVVAAQLGSPEVHAWDLRNLKDPTMRRLEHTDMIIERLQKRGVLHKSLPVHMYTAISHDEELIATGVLGGVNLWRNKLETPYALTLPLNSQQQTNMYMKFSSDRRWFVMGRETEKYLTLWNLHHLGDPEHVFLIDGVRGKTFYITSDSKLLIGESDDEILSFNLTGDKPHRVTGHPVSDKIVKLLVDSNNRFVVFSTPDNEIKVIDITLKQNKPIKLGTHISTISALAISSDGRWLVSGTMGGTIGIWELASQNNLPRRHSLINPNHGDILDIAFHPQENVFATAGYNATAGLWKIVTGPKAHLLKTVKGHAASFNSVWFTSEGKKLLANGWYSLQAWDVDNCIHPDSELTVSEDSASTIPTDQ